MSYDVAIKVENLSKCYQIFDNPRDWLKQFILPRLQNATGKQAKQYFREFWALQDVSFEVKKGEAIGIIGRNGSGKSTLLQMICGTLHPSGGNIIINGRIAALLELGSGFNPEFTGRENVYLNASILGLSDEECSARFSDITAFADIGEFIDQPLKTYSSGMMVRLAFAVSVCVDPDILVIDEALSVGDAAFQFKCMERMKLLTESGTTLLFVSHDIAMVKSFCTRAIYLERGRSKFQGSANYVAEKYIMDITQEQRKNHAGEMRVFEKAPLNEYGLPAFGASEGQIVSACFLPDGNTNAVTNSGDKIRIRVEVEYSFDFSDPALSIILMDRRMLDIAGKFFMLKPLAVTEASIHSAIEVEFEAKLRPDTYLITLRLENRSFGSDNFFLLDRQPGALSFQVVARHVEFLGTMDLGITEVQS